MPNCAAIGCQNRYETRSDLLWKYLPTSKQHIHLKKLWLTKLKRKDGTLPKERSIVLCSEHFTEECFERDFKKEFELQSDQHFYKIKEDAIPTKFVHANISAPSESTKSRSKRAEKRRIIDEACSTSPLFAESNESCISTSSSIVSGKASCTSTGANTSDSKTYCEISVNTDVTFSPYSNVTFSHFPSDRMTEYITYDVPESHTAIHAESTFSADDNNSDLSDHDDGGHDDDYTPQFDTDVSSTESEVEELGEEYHSTHNGMKYLVFFSCLLPLLRNCFSCNASAEISKIFTKGTALCVKLLCPYKHISTWYSQPMIGDIFLGNLQAVSSIVFSGGTFKQFRDMADILHLQMLCESAFYKLQSKYVFGAINKVYKEYRGQILNKFTNTSVLLSGDGRHDSPGHNAKYCTYSVMDQILSQIVHFHVICVAETEGKSNLMEKEGLIRVLKKLDSCNVKIKSITTDRHTQIRKYIRENSDIRHQFDVWHAAKSIRGKITSVAKLKANSDLTVWIKSIDNHFWWCCESSKGNLEELTEKWLSILFHICNIHEFPGNKVFKRCQHGYIERQWLSPDSSSFLALKKIITEKRFLSDLKYFTDFLHTGNLEVFHALLLKYVPKRLHFSMWGMISRTQLAVLHFNEAMKCGHALTKDRMPRYKLQLSKMSKKFVVKPIKTAPEKTYIGKLMTEVINMIEQPFSHKPVIPRLPVIYEKPVKEEVISEKYTRFST